MKKGSITMKTVKRLGALLCAGAMIFGLSACGGGGASVVDTLNAADDKLSAVNSLQCKGVIDMAMTATAEGTEPQEVAVTADMDLSVIQEPMKMKGTINLNMAELGGSMGMDIYAVEEDGILNAYVGFMGQWMMYSMDMSELEGMNETADTADIDIYAENESTAKKVGTEKIGEVDTTKYAITISGASMNKIMTESGVIDAMQGMGDMGTGMEIDWADLYSEMGDMTMSIWIDADGYPVRYEVDAMNMANLMVAKVMAQMTELYGDMGAAVNFTKLLITIDLAAFDTVEDFEIPAEVTENAYPLYY